jgi:major membrane immunogen (membrane-anchored lipoprotein)
MKKIISILICVVMILGLVGCSKNENSDINTTTNTVKSEQEKQLEKDIKESKVVYANYIKEVRTLYPYIKVKYIIEDRDSEGNKMEGHKTMTVNMNTIGGTEKTYRMYFEFVDKETENLINKNITKIVTIFYDKKEIKGMSMSTLQDGKYVPVINTLNEI